MKQKQFMRLAATVSAAGLGVGVAGYAVYAGATWLHYGKPRKTCEGSDRVPASEDLIRRSSENVIS